MPIYQNKKFLISLAINLLNGDIPFTNTNTSLYISRLANALFLYLTLIVKYKNLAHVFFKLFK